ncbi:MAG: hypothetical protein L0216_06450 [Planctomycetales bacterium]|nr:hypothetical protein [Planctomycetales bacterium]
METRVALTLLTVGVGLAFLLGAIRPTTADACPMIALGTIAFLVFLVGNDVRRGWSLDRVYRRVARRHGAFIHRAPWPKGPRLEWTLGRGVRPEAWCALGPVLVGDGKVARTRFAIRSAGGLPVAVEVSAPPAPVAPGRPVELPGATGLRAVAPSGFSPVAAADLLDAYTLQPLLGLLGPARGSGFRASVTPGGLAIEVGRVLRVPRDLDALVDAGLALLRRGRVLAQSPGRVEFVRPPPAATAETAPVCAVCVTEIPGPARHFCPECGAPHHRDCWDWAGRCGTFGCEAKAEDAPPAAA